MRPRLQSRSSGCALPWASMPPIVPEGRRRGGALVTLSRTREDRRVATPLDPTALGFLMAENRRMPMHVGGLQLYKKPEGAGRNYVRDLFEEARDTTDIAPLFLKHPHRSIKTAGQWVWVEDDQFDIEHHVRHSALPKPGRVRELFELVSRLHSTRLATERPLWEWHLIEGLRDGRVAMYTKLHHSLVDGISAMRLLQSILSSDPDDRGMPVAVGRPAARAPRSARRRRPPSTSASSEAIERAAYGARHQRRRGRHAQGADQDAQQEPAQRDLDARPLRAADDPQPRDHRVAPVRRPGLADRADPRHRQGHRHHDERRRAGDVQRRDAHLPLRARRAARHHADRDGPGRACTPESRSSVDGRQRRRLDHGQARHRPARRRVAAQGHPREHARRQGGAVDDDADADPGDERGRPGARDPADAARA